MVQAAVLEHRLAFVYEATVMQTAVDLNRLCTGVAFAISSTADGRVYPDCNLVRAQRVSPVPGSGRSTTLRWRTSLTSTGTA